MAPTTLVVDAHLDLAYNGLRGRDVRDPAANQPPDEDGFATVGLPDLRRGNVNLICGTLFAQPPSKWRPVGYTTAAEAMAQVRRQLELYEKLSAEGLMRLAARASDMDEIPVGEAHPVRYLMLMEGGDPLASAEDVAWWYGRGLRIVGLAWHRTRHAGGTGMPGPLSEEGRAMVKCLDAVKMIHDASHLAEESFWDLAKLSDGPMMASHSNCRAIVPTDRHLTDEMIRAIGRRGGVIGLNYYEKFLLPPEEVGRRRVTHADVIRHVRRICDLTGSTAHVGIGTDMDGGFGREQIPVEVKSSEDLWKLGEDMAKAGFGAEDVRGMLSENWVRFFRQNLPA